MIGVERLSFSYDGNQIALRDLCFTVDEGEIFGLLGPSGAGKSTTQRILIQLLRGYSGNIEVFGRPLSGWGKAYFEQVGVSFELPNHFQKLTAVENLRYFGALYQVKTIPPREALELVGLEGDAHKRVSEFSKGMRVRLNLARSLLHRPRLIFLDEPTSGLDPVNAGRIRDLIVELRSNGATIFLTTHDMHLADALCDRVAFMVDGELVATDSPRAFKLRHGRPSVRVEVRTADGGLERHDFPLAGLRDNAAFLRTLDREVETIHSQETTLDEVFGQVTGRSLT